MPAGKHKSRSMRRVFVKTPGGNNVVQYRKRKPSSQKCQMCGLVLPGTPRERPTKMQNMPKSMKRPERPFGGCLCTKCSREVIKLEARASKEE